MSQSQNVQRGIFYMVFANISFTIMVCLVRYGAGSMPYTTTMFRFVTGIGIIGLLAMSGRAQLTFVNRRALFFRGLFGSVAICFSFISIIKLGIIRGSVITNTYPIFAALFSVVILREQMSVMRILAVVASFAGMVLLFAGRGDALSSGETFYEILGLAGAILGGLAVIYVKKLQKTDSTISIYFAQCLMGIWIVMVPSSIESHTITIPETAVLVGIGVFATVGQLLFTAAYRYITVSVGSVITMSGPIMTFLAGYFLFKEKLNVTMGIGAIMVIVACLFVAKESGKRA